MSRHRAQTPVVVFLCTLFTCFVHFAAIPSVAIAAGPVPLDASCRGVRTEVLPVLSYPRKGEPVAEHREITLQLLSLIPCSAPSRVSLAGVESVISKGASSGRGVQEVAEDLLGHFRERARQGGETGTRTVFALVSEFYDNLSLTLFEFSPGRDPVSIKLTMKRDAWTDALETLRPRFENSETSFLAAWDKTSARRSVRISFDDTLGTVDNATLQRLRSELEASLTSRYRNPLPPKLWERRAFFRLADEKEQADATLHVRVELSGTRVFVQVMAKQSDVNARSLWLEGSLASLIELETKLFEDSRDMLMELVGIYDYTMTFGPEILFGSERNTVLPSLSTRHNRGDLAATFRVRAGRMNWKGTCGSRPLLVDFGLLPGWQFFQTERLSMDMGVELAAGVIDIAFEGKDGCTGKPQTETFISTGYGLFAQANYTTVNRFSILGRVAAGGIAVIGTGDKGNDDVRSLRAVSVFLGVGLAL